MSPDEMVPGQHAGLPAERPMLTLGQPFSERLDRSIDRFETPAGDGGGASGGSSTFTHPFQLQDVSTDIAAKINVRYGTCQDIAPTNVATDITISGAGTHRFYLDVEIDDPGAIVGVTLSHGTSGQPDDDDNHAYITIGTVVVDGDGVITTINQAATHSLRFRICDRIQADEEVDPPVEFDPGTYHFWGF